MNQILAERWRTKLRERTRARPALGLWAVHVFDSLLERQSIAAQNFPHLAANTGVPLKFVHRAVAVLYRFGLITVRDKRGSLELELQQRKTLKALRSRNTRRRSVTPKMKALVYELDAGVCAMTGRKLTLQQAVLDHIIPFAYGGADELSNLTVMCSRVNTAKATRLYPELTFYRGKPVEGPVGMHWRQGAFYPVINRRRRLQRWS